MKAILISLLLLMSVASYATAASGELSNEQMIAELINNPKTVKPQLVILLRLNLKEEVNNEIANEAASHNLDREAYINDERSLGAFARKTAGTDLKGLSREQKGILLVKILLRLEIHEDADTETEDQTAIMAALRQYTQILAKELGISIR